MRVLVLHNAVSEADAADDRDVLVQVEAVATALQRLGHEVLAASCTLDLQAMRDRLRALRPEVAFNLVESLEGDDALAFLVPAVLDVLELPYTGSSSASILATGQKLWAKRRLREAGLPTPDWLTVDGPFLSAEKPAVAVNGAPLPDGQFFPESAAELGAWLIKGVWEQGSRHLDEESLCAGDLYAVADQLRRRNAELGRRCYAERFIAGREFNISLLAGPDGPQVLPPAEIDFAAFPPGKPRMVGYRAKWDPASFEYQHTPRRFDFPPEDTPLLLRLRELCLQCWELFTLGGYARVDFRVDHQGNPWILEVNANPCLSPDAGFAAALGQAGISFDQAIAQILRCAVERKLREHSLATATVAVRSATRPSFSAPSTPPARLPPANETLRAALNPLEEAIFPPGGNWTFRHEVRAGDVAAVRRLAETAGIFRPAEIAVAVELVEQRLAHGPASGYEFIFAERPEPPKKQGQAEDEESVVGYVCYGPITMTVGGYDLYWIVVNRHHQGQGLGSALLNQCEQVILRQGGRRVYVETSGRAEYAATRAFYEHRGYRRAAVVGDFYSPGDDKIIYLKSLPTAEPCADSLRNSMEP